VLMIGDKRLFKLCLLTFLALYFGLIPAEEEFLSQKFLQEYEKYCRNVPRLLPRVTPWAESVKTPFDRQSACGEGWLSLILLGILGLFRGIAALRGAGRAEPGILAKPRLHTTVVAQVPRNLSVFRTNSPKIPDLG
jgi:hypothetical protein